MTEAAARGLVNQLLAMMDDFIARVSAWMSEESVEAAGFGHRYTAVKWHYSFETYRAIRVLLGSGFPEQAFALLRVLADTAVQVRYLMAGMEDIDELAMRLAWESHRDTRGMLEAEKHLLANDSAAAREPHEKAIREHEEQGENLLSIAKTLGFSGQPAAPPGPEKMASDLKMVQYPFAAKAAGAYVHGGNEAIFGKVQEVGNDYIIGVAPSPNTTIQVGLSATSLAIPMLGSIAGLFAWKSFDEIVEYALEVAPKVTAIGSGRVAANDE